MSVACQQSGAQPDAAAGSCAGSGGFAADGGSWRYAGDLTLDNAAAVLEASRALPLPANGAIDVGALGHADSAALAVLIAVWRRAELEGRKLTFVGTPQPLRSLAIVYGVEELLT